MKIFAKTDIGLVRSTNEDTFTIIKKDENNYIAFVCDGMGGHLGGAFASSKTVEFLNNAYNELEVTKPLKNVGVWLFDTLQKANDYIFEQSLCNENLKGMGTTVTGVICFNGELYYAHCGDSRVYSYNSKELQQITTDHTYVYALLINGLITLKQAQKHPKRHVLTNALGIKRKVSVDIGQIRIKDDENLLICSDGLYNMLDNKKLLKTLNENIDTQVKVENLVLKAIDAGGNDNITLILLEK